MPSFYQPPFRKSNARRASFARQMMFAAFGHRYGRAIDQGGFQDRKPYQQPPRIHEIGRRS